MTSDYLISCFYCIIQFGLKKNIRKERGCCDEKKEEKKEKKTNNTKTQTTNNSNNNKKLLNVITFQIVLYYAFLWNKLIQFGMKAKKNHLQFCQIYFKKSYLVLNFRKWLYFRLNSLMCIVSMCLCIIPWLLNILHMQPCRPTWSAV